MSLKPQRTDFADLLEEAFRRIRALEASVPPEIAPCPQWIETNPTVILSGGSADPAGYTATQLDETCTTGLGAPGTFYVHGDLRVTMGSTPGTGGSSSLYVVEGFPYIGGIGDSLGYGFTHDAGANIYYPSLLMSNGGILILGVADTGGGTLPGYARPGFPFTFGNGDILFDGHYAYWGKESL